MGKLENKTTVVTGGGSNIGKAIASIFAKEGAEISIWEVNEERGKKVVDLIRDEGNEATYVKCDVTKPNSINEAIVETKERYGNVNILINNVGKAKGLNLENIDENAFQKNVDENLKSAFFCTKEVLPDLIEKGSGSVIFISSINALLGGFSETAYSASKAGLHSLAKSLTADYSKFGIRFNVICPGTVPEKSETWIEREEKWPGTLEELKELYPLNDYGKPEDIAHATLFLASDEARWITGVILPVDGGLTATGNLPGGEWWKRIGGN